MIILPDEVVPAISDLTANNILIYGDYGIGKSGLLASTGYLIANPESENKIRQYPCLPVQLKNWQDHKDFVTALSKAEEGKYKGVGLDSLNISYDHCLTWVMANIKFNGLKLSHPSENPTTAYPRITMEFINWLREITYLGYHVVATCHSNITEVKSPSGYSFNSYIPSFTGGSATSTYAGVLKVFSVIGFMTMEEVEKPPTATKMGKQVVDVRADGSRILINEGRVIHFNQSKHWLANNKHGGFPDKVVLTNNWEDDWNILKESWGKEGHTMVEEVVKTEGLEVEE